MVDPVAEEQAAPTVKGDRAEVDLPVASRILGGESLFLQARAGPLCLHSRVRNSERKLSR